MARHCEEANPVKRSGYWYLFRRVPDEFAAYEKRQLVKITTRIRVADDPLGLAARPVVAKLDAALFSYWRDCKSGRKNEAAITFDRSMEILRRRGLEYRSIDELAKGPTTELWDRLELFLDAEQQKNKEAVHAVMGLVDKPQIMLSEMRGLYEELIATEFAKKSEHQKKRWRVYRDSAVDTFIEVIGGDRPMADLTKADVLKVRKHWQDRIIQENLAVDTGNKGLNRVGSMFREINERRSLDLKDVFEKTRIPGGSEYDQRVAFEVKFVQEKILAEGMFDDVNEEARRLIYLVADTGLRPSEACNLLPSRIHLNAEVPFIEIRADGRQLKTKESKRDIPLVGLALEVMKLQPEGFPRYRLKENSLSAVVSDALTSRELLAEEGQSFYSLRHTFDDKMENAGASSKMKAVLMGHAYDEVKYGKGPGLKEKAEWLAKIGYKAPARL